MTRDMTLTVALMLTSIAAAVAAPEIDLGSSPAESIEMKAVASDTYSLGNLGSSRGGLVAVRTALPTPLSVEGAVVIDTHHCAADEATEVYRQWHYGAARVVPACVVGGAST